mmetsp:Transcript_152132/g.291363  ORF Transcript_152132/g.291363 Transcript_152132/m.291363 type:complete len:692 (-) Transcript_152132:150-2225(-)
MITYDTGGLHFLFNLFKVYGSVFPKALVVSIPSMFVSAGFVFCIHDRDMFENFKDPESVMNNNAIWGGFSFLVGFLVVFRTSQAYNRFWEGCTQMHKMGAEWFDSCSSLMAFCKHSEVDRALILQFQNMLIRLFSMLHAAALGEIEDCGSAENYMEVQAFNMELIDAESVENEALRAIRDSDAKVELIFQWIQQLVVENIKTGVLSIPPPILSRSFQEIATGMVHFHEAMKISNVPFPFPYAQTCDCLLMFHWFLVPFISSQWVTKAWWAGVFSFIQVFTFWTLNLIAVELENPFGTDPNDIDGAHMQLEMNNHLRLLIRPETWKTPKLAKLNAQGQDAESVLTLQAYMSAGGPTSTFHKIWKGMDFNEAAARRYSRVNAKVSQRSSRVQKGASRLYGSSSSMTSAQLASSNHQPPARIAEESALVSEYTDSSKDSKVREGKESRLLASPITQEAHASAVQQEHVMVNGQDLLQQGMWEPYPDGINGATRYQTPSRNVGASPETATPTPYSREISESYQGTHEGQENTLQLRLGEIFDQLESGLHPAVSTGEGRFQDIQESQRQEFVHAPDPMHAARPPSEPSSPPSSESQGPPSNWPSGASDATLGQAALRARMLVPPPALLRPSPTPVPPMTSAPHRTPGTWPPDGTGPPDATIRSDPEEVSLGSPAWQSDGLEPNCGAEVMNSSKRML